MAPDIGVPQTPFALVQSRRHEAPAQPKGSRCGGCPGRCTGRRGSPHPQTLETHRPDPPPRPWPVGSPRPRPRPAGTTSGHSPGRGHPPPPPVASAAGRRSPGAPPSLPEKNSPRRQRATREKRTRGCALLMAGGGRRGSRGKPGCRSTRAPASREQAGSAVPASESDGASGGH